MIVFSAMAFIAGGYSGFSLSSALEQRHSWPARVVTKVNSVYRSIVNQGKPVSDIVTTNRLSLKASTYYLPLEVANSAGGIAPDNSGGVLVLDRTGKTYRFINGATERLDVETPDSNVAALRRQLKSGLLGNIEINFDWFRFNDILYVSRDKSLHLLVSYSEWHEDKLCFTSSLAKANLASGDPSTWHIKGEDWEVIARTRPCLPTQKAGQGIMGLEAGGRLAFQGGSGVLWTSGSFERDDKFDKEHPEHALAQNDANDYGKVLLVDIDSGAVEIIAKGLRNPQGISIDASGNAWVTDHGMRGGDELNLVRHGANFGFPAVTLGTQYSKKPGGVQVYHTGHQGYDKPAVSFVPSIAPTAVLYIDDYHPSWDGNILIGGLNGYLYRVYLEDRQVLFVEPIELRARLRDMHRTSDGKIVLWTDDLRLVFLEPNENPSPYEVLEALITAGSAKDLGDSVRATFDSCIQCHGLEMNEERAGPTLYRVCGREPGTAGFSGYSGALNAVGDRWDRQSLSNYIADPEEVAPGTSMAWGGIESEAVADALAEALCELSKIQASPEENPSGLGLAGDRWKIHGG